MQRIFTLLPCGLSFHVSNMLPQLNSSPTTKTARHAATTNCATCRHLANKLRAAVICLHEYACNACLLYPATADTSAFKVPLLLFVYIFCVGFASTHSFTSHLLLLLLVVACQIDTCALSVSCILRASAVDIHSKSCQSLGVYLSK